MVGVLTRPDAVTAAATTDVEEEVSTREKTALAAPWHVLVHDDPITLMSYVTMVLKRIFGYPHPKAYRLMMTVHTRGKAVVWTGEREQAELYLQKLHGAQLLATMEKAPL